MTGMNGADVTIAVGPEDYGQNIIGILSDLPFPVYPCHSLDDLITLKPTVVILDAILLGRMTVEALRDALPGVFAGQQGLNCSRRAGHGVIRDAS